MPDNDRSPKYVTSRYKRALEAVQLAPELVGEAVVSAALRRFRKVQPELKPAIEEAIRQFKDLLQLPPNQRQAKRLDLKTFTDLCNTRDQKILTRAILKLRGTLFRRAEVLTEKQIRKAIGAEWIREEVKAGFVSPVEYRVARGITQAAPVCNFAETMTQVEATVDAVAGEKLERWAETGKRHHIERMPTPKIGKLGTEEVLTSSKHDEMPNLGDFDDERISDEAGGKA
jgi:hypothetical protein